MKEKIIIGALVIVILAAVLTAVIKSRLADEIGVLGSWDSTQGEGFHFNFPRRIGAEYTFTYDWPPKIIISDAPYLCTTAGTEIARAGETEERTIDGHTYCVTEIKNSGDGNIYTQYAYVFVKDDRTVALAFSTRSLQCNDLNEKEQELCEAERKDLNLDSLIDDIAQTIKFN